MVRTERKWKFSLLFINLTVIFVLLFQAMVSHIPFGKELWHIALYALIFSNAVGIPSVAWVPSLIDALLRRRMPILPVVLFALVVAIVSGCFFAQNVMVWLHFASRQTFWRDYFSILRVGLSFGVALGFGAFLYGALRERLQQAEKKLHEKEVAEERTRKLEAEARLRWLESRIHPHFLFNTLNSISSLIPNDPMRAEQMVGRLASLLRASLDSTNQSLIPLEQELIMVENYLDIEKARFGSKLHGTVEIPPELKDAKVPPLAIQSLVENAVKYGITPQKTGGELLVRAFAQNGDLHVEVSDSGPGFELTAVPAGHGLDNLVGRLDAIFGDRAGLNVTRREGRCVVQMILPR